MPLIYTCFLLDKLQCGLKWRLERVSYIEGNHFYEK